jgi:hypothetical protein
MARKGPADYYLSGAWNFRCQECGKKLKSVDALFRWDGLWVGPECYEVRNPQDFLRPIPDYQGLPWSTGDPTPRLPIGPPTPSGTICIHGPIPFGWGMPIGSWLVDGGFVVGTAEIITGFLQQENLFYILQEDGFHIQIT